MTNLKLMLLLLVALPTFLFGQATFDLDLPLQTKVQRDQEGKLLFRKVESDQVMAQIDALEEWALEERNYFTLNLTIDNQDYHYSMKRLRNAEKVEVQFGVEPPVEMSFLTYTGLEEKNSAHAATIVLGDDGKVFFTKENPLSEYTIIKTYKTGESKADYIFYHRDLLDPEEDLCGVDHNNVSSESIGEGGGAEDRTHCARREYIVDLGVGTDFEFIFSEAGGDFTLVPGIVTARATTAAGFYASCDMRVVLRLGTIVVELFNDLFWKTPYCRFRPYTDAFIYNQRFASSPFKPAGDVTTLWAGVELSGGACIGDIGGMANLIGGACGYRNTNVCQGNRSGALQAHEIGHNLGIGINHGNIPDGFFYGDYSPNWHINTLNTMQSTMKGKKCIEKIDHCCFDVDDVYLCSEETDFCIDIPDCAGNIDLSAHPELFINASGQLCGTATSSYKYYHLNQLSPNLNCYINSFTFSVRKCVGNTPSYAHPPLGMNKICINSTEVHCQRYDCIVGWQQIGTNGGINVTSFDGQICISSTGVGAPGLTTITIRPILSCGSMGPPATWSIELEDCGGTHVSIDEYQNPVHNEVEPVISQRSNTLNIQSANIDLPIQVQLYTIDGKLLRTRKDAGSFDFDLSGLPAGLYIAVVRQGEHQEIRKVFKE